MPEVLYRGGSFEIGLEKEGELAVVRLKGEFTEPDVAPLAGTLGELAHSYKGVLVDITGVRYVPSRMIAPLARAAMGAGFLAVVVPPGSRERVFKLVGVDKTLRLFTDEDAARAAFLASGGSCE
jgi:anti-anti-sigma regulatory factor